MKIKCKKCGKHFDSDIYSGLCPKCGTYNGVHMDETDVSRYLSSSYSGEESHQKLHEMYGDTGHDGSAHRKLHEDYDQSYRAAHPVHTDLPEEKGSRIPGLLSAFLLFLIVLLPIFCAFSYREWKEDTIREALAFEVRQQTGTVGNFTVLEGGVLEYPIHVTLLEAGEASLSGPLQKGKKLVEVKASIESEDYNFGTALEASLQYQSGGSTFYRKPLDEYALRDYLPLLGISEEDLLSAYNPGNGKESSGYYYFIVEEDARDMKLFLSVRENRELQRVFLEGEIALDSVWNAESGKGDR